jgi:hypothetical protein
LGTFPTEPAANGGLEIHAKVPKPEPVLPEELKRLSDWMVEHHAALQEQTVRKAGEYGALDLKVMGASLAEVLSELGGDDAPPAAKLQAAIAFYLLGKVSRVISALAEGKPAPTDSWLDAQVYSMMGSYVQEHGQWP